MFCVQNLGFLKVNWQIRHCNFHGIEFFWPVSYSFGPPGKSECWADGRRGLKKYTSHKNGVLSGEIAPVSLVTQWRFEGQSKFWFERVLDDY